MTFIDEVNESITSYRKEYKEAGQKKMIPKWMLTKILEFIMKVFGNRVKKYVYNTNIIKYYARDKSAIY